MDKSEPFIDTGGGAYNPGTVSTGGGNFIGRDEVKNYYGPTYPRLNYRSDIAGIIDFYTKIFVRRLDTWLYIANFALQQTPSYLVVEALPGYGKSALMAHLVHRQETGQWDRPSVPSLLYFFIRYEGGRHTPVAFLQALNSQLLNLLQGDGGVPADLSSLRSQFSYLWPQAVAKATAEQPLLLLIDGLDEMAWGETTIADELPALAEDHTFVHVVVSSHSNPKPLERVAINHPFRCAAVHRLQTFTVLEVQALLQESALPVIQAAALAPRVHTLTKVNRFLRALSATRWLVCGS